MPVYKTAYCVINYSSSIQKVSTGKITKLFKSIKSTGLQTLFHPGRFCLYLNIISI